MISFVIAVDDLLRRKAGELARAFRTLNARSGADDQNKQAYQVPQIVAWLSRMYANVTSSIGLLSLPMSGGRWWQRCLEPPLRASLRCMSFCETRAISQTQNQPCTRLRSNTHCVETFQSDSWKSNRSRA